MLDLLLVTGLLWVVLGIIALVLGAGMREYQRIEKERKPFLRDVAQARYDAYVTAHPERENYRSTQKWKQHISRIPRHLRDTR